MWHVTEMGLLIQASLQPLCLRSICTAQGGSPGVHKHDMGRGSEVQGNAASLQGHEEDCDARLIGEGVDHAIARVHAHAAL